MSAVVEASPAPAPLVRDALVAATVRLADAGVPEARTDAEVLLAHALGTDRAGVVVRARDAMPAAAARRFDALLARRERREPVAYVLGEREFWSVGVAVDRRVFIPRPETELVIETALRVAPAARRVLDLCTGSGAIAIAFARERPAARVVACELVSDALAVARANAVTLAPGVGLVRGDLATAFRAGTFDLVVANPPYCAEGTVVQAEVRDFEPVTALYAGPDGLAVLDRLVAETPDVLVPGGWLVTEIGIGQAAAVAARADADGRWDRVLVERDLGGRERVCALRRREAAE